MFIIIPFLKSSVSLPPEGFYPRGYFGGGDASSYSYLNEIDGIDFNTETAINPAATLAVARKSLAGVQSGSL